MKVRSDTSKLGIRINVLWRHTHTMGGIEFYEREGIRIGISPAPVPASVEVFLASLKTELGRHAQECTCCEGKALVEDLTPDLGFQEMGPHSDVKRTSFYYLGKRQPLGEGEPEPEDVTPR